MKVQIGIVEDRGVADVEVFSPGEHETLTRFVVLAFRKEGGNTRFDLCLTCEEARVIGQALLACGR